MVKAQEAKIETLEKKINALRLQRRHVMALIQGEKRKLHNHLDLGTLPLTVQDRAEIAWVQLILLFEEGLNQIDQDLQREIMSLIIENENIKRESGQGHK